MPKITNEAKEYYRNHIAPFVAIINSLKKKRTTCNGAIKRDRFSIRKA